MLYELTLLLAVILILYGKTYKYNILLDDEVPRGGYLGVLTTDPGIRPKVGYYDHRRSWLATFTNIGTFILCVWVMYLNFGFWPALLFAVCPTNVCGVAWSTGNYYMFTTFYVLVVYFFANLGGWVGSICVFVFFWVSLETSVASIPYPFFAMLTQGGWQNAALFIPLILFLTGKRFRLGLRKRKDLHDDHGLESGKIYLQRFYIVPKIIAYYICLAIFPNRLGFFHDCIRLFNYKTPDKYFWLSLVVIALFSIWGIWLDWQMTLFYLLFIGLFSQYITYGMMIAERYLFIPNIAFCVLLTKQLPNSWLICLATLWAARTFLYIRAYKDNEALFKESCRAFPETSENYNNLAAIYMERRQPELALAPLLLGLKLDKTPTFNAIFNTAMCFEGIGRFQDALIYTNRALSCCPLSEKNNVEMMRIRLLNRMATMKDQIKVLKKYKIM